MEENFQDIGEEEIRAKMEIGKISLAAVLGLGFSLVLGVAFIIPQLLAGGPAHYLGLAFIFLLFMKLKNMILDFVNETMDSYLELAKELDRRKMEEADGGGD